MQISDEWVEKYQKLYLKEYGKEIEKAQARDELTALVCYINAVHRHHNKDYEK